MPRIENETVNTERTTTSPVSSVRDVRAEIVRQAEVAKKEISPDLDLVFLGPRDRDQRLQYMIDSVRRVHGNSLQLSGDISLFVRRHPNARFHGDPIGVPIKVINEDGEIETRPFIGLYIPNARDQGWGEATKIQQALDHDLGVVYNRLKDEETRISCHDGLLVVTKDLISFWHEFGMWEDLGPKWEHEVDEDTAPGIENGAAGALAREAELAHEAEAERFMREEYFPRLMWALGVLGDNNAVPAQLLPSDHPGTVMTAFGEHFLSVKFGVMTSTNHTQTLKIAVYDRDSWLCQFPYGQGPLTPDQRFDPEELVMLEEQISRFRAGEDPAHNLIGTDLSGVEFDEESADRFRCGLRLQGRYPEIHPASHRIDPTGTYANLHHIIPRGAAYRALLTAFLMDEENLAEASISQLAMLLRGSSIPYLVSDQSLELFRDQGHVLDVLERRIFQIDSTVNSPYNLIMLCGHHHNDIVHPDMKYGRQFAALFRAFDSRQLTLRLSDEGHFSDTSDFLTDKLMRMQMNEIPDLKYDQVMKAIKLARQLVLASGGTYWRQDTADQMLDWSRVSTEKVIRREKDQVIDTILSEEQSVREWSERQALWQSAQTTLDSDGSQFWPIIGRRATRLEQFQDWRNPEGGLFKEPKKR